MWIIKYFKYHKFFIIQLENLVISKARFLSSEKNQVPVLLPQVWENCNLFVRLGSFVCLQFSKEELY